MHVLDEIQRQGWRLREPTPIRNREYLNTKKYCRFHKDVGHNTEDCRVLRKEIEKLIQEGRLSQFVASQRATHRKETRYLKETAPEATSGDAATLANQPTAGTINVITGPAPEQVHLAHQAPKRRGAEEDRLVTFSEKDAGGESGTLDDAIVISSTISNFQVKRIMVDSGSSANILFRHCSEKMKIAKEALRPMLGRLTGFTGDGVFPEGMITLPVTVGDDQEKSTASLDFLVVDTPSAYNAILGRPGLNKLKAVISTRHRAIKFPAEGGTGICRRDRRTAQEGHEIAAKEKPPGNSVLIDSTDPGDEQLAAKNELTEPPQAVPLVT